MMPLETSEFDLETTSINDLRGAYINAFFVSRKSHERPVWLEKVAKVFSERPLEEKLRVLSLFYSMRGSSVKNEDYERAAAVRDLIDYYKKNVLWAGNESFEE